MSERTSSKPLGGDELMIGAVILVGGLSLGIWAGAQLATFVTSGRWLPATIGDGLSAMLRLPANAGDPAMAWPASVRHLLPGAVVYWLATVLVVSVELLALALSLIHI